MAWLEEEGPKTLAQLEEKFGAIYRRLVTLEKNGCLRRRMESNPEKGQRWARTYKVLFEPTGKAVPPTKADNPKAYYRLWYALNRARTESTRRNALEEFGEWADAFGFVTHGKDE